MAGKISVKDGECVASVATMKGFSWQKLFDHPENAALKSLRKNPNLLAAGDQLFVPDRKPKTVSVPTDSLHKFKVKGMAVRLRLKLVDADGKPMSGKKWALKVGATEATGTTGGDGLVDAVVPADATTGELSVTLVEGSPPARWPLAVGALGPAKETRGVQSRLRNLGFECGKPDGAVGPGTKEALMAFQKKNGLAAKGELDDATREKVLSTYGL